MISTVKGGLIRIATFTSSGTWTKGNDVGSVVVQVVGGGAGANGTQVGGTAVVGTSGGTTSFGSHCSATGGTASLTEAQPGGSGSNGDINSSGGFGGTYANGSSSIGHPKRATSSISNGAGGGGSYIPTGSVIQYSSMIAAGGGTAIKRIDVVSLGSSEAVTIGAGGAGGYSGNNNYARGFNGGVGIVIVYEYSK